MLGRVFDNSRIFLRLGLCPTQLLSAVVVLNNLGGFLKSEIYQILSVSKQFGNCFRLILEMKKGCFVVGYMIRKANLHNSCFRLQSDYCSWCEQCLLHFQPQTISKIVLKANIDICCKFKCNRWDFVVFS